MEVQTFVLCQELRKTGEGSRYDAQMLGLHSFSAVNDQFPLQFGMPYFMLVRRSTRGAEEDIKLQVRLIDEDGRLVGEPATLKLVGKFPDGARFITIHGVLPLSFPGTGDFRIDIFDEADMTDSIFHYVIEITDHVAE